MGAVYAALAHGCKPLEPRHDRQPEKIMPKSPKEMRARNRHMTAALSDLKGITPSRDRRRDHVSQGDVYTDVIALAHRLSMLMDEFRQSLEDGFTTVNDTKPAQGSGRPATGIARHEAEP